MFDIHRPGREFTQHSTLQGSKEGQSGIPFYIFKYQKNICDDFEIFKISLGIYSCRMVQLFDKEEVRNWWQSCLLLRYIGEWSEKWLLPRGYGLMGIEVCSLTLMKTIGCFLLTCHGKHGMQPHLNGKCIWFNEPFTIVRYDPKNWKTEISCSIIHT